MRGRARRRWLRVRRLGADVRPTRSPRRVGPSQKLGSALGVALVGVVFFGVLGEDPSPARYEDALLAGTRVTITAFALASLAAALLPAHRVARPADGSTPLADAASSGSPSNA